MSILTTILLVALVLLILWKFFGEAVMAMPVVVRVKTRYFGTGHDHAHGGHDDGHGHDDHHGGHDSHGHSEEYVKIAVCVPIAYSDIVRDALAQAGAGAREGYVSESFAVRGMGRWKKAGENGAGEFMYAEEDKIEAVVTKNHLPVVLSELRKVHVSSHMAIDTYPVELH